MVFMNEYHDNQEHRSLCKPFLPETFSLVNLFCLEPFCLESHSFPSLSGHNLSGVLVEFVFAASYLARFLMG